MGALEIRRASAQVNQLGSVRMPELDNGAARAWQAQANAALTAAQAAQTAGRATVEAITRRGEIISNTLENLRKVAEDLYDRENERVTDEAYLELKRRTIAEMYGDENGNGGRMNEKPKDVKAWMKDFEGWNNRTVEELSANMNARQRVIFQKKIASQQLGLQTAVAEHVARYTQARQETAAEAITKDKLDTAKLQFGNPKLRDTAIDAYVKAKRREFDLKGVPEAARAPMMRTAMRDLISGGWDAFTTQWEAEAAKLDDPEAVRRFWEQKQAEAKQAGYTLNSAEVKKQMPDGLTEAEKQMFAKRLEETARRSTAFAEQLKTKRENDAKDAAREREIKLIQTPPSGNDYADDEQLACGYDELANDMKLPSETRLSYARTAASMRKAIARQKETEKAERTRQDRAEKRETMREAKEIVANRLERQFRDDLDNFKAGWTYDENGETVDLTVYDMMNRAKTGLDSGRYTVQQFRELMSVPERKWDEESEDLRDHVIAIARQITPYVVYNRQEDRFAFRPDRKTTSKSSSGIEFGTRDGTQQATYGQLIRALNLTLAAKKNSRMSAADAKRYFDEITAGTVRAQMQATIDENLDYDEQFINAFRSK